MKRTQTAARTRQTCSDRNGDPISSYRDIVSAYIRDYRAAAAAELDFFRKQPFLATAIHFAALSINPKGKRHAHQRRLSANVLGAAERKLLAGESRLQQCHSFTELHDIVEAKIGEIRGIGALTIYDVATRIGGYLRREPEVVYLHAGASKGARALGLDGGKKLDPRALPVAFRVLRPREIEDCLCIYSGDLARLRSNKPFHLTPGLAPFGRSVRCR